MDLLVPDDFESRVREYWAWIGISLFMLVTVDLLTTTVAVSEFGLHAEGNPIMRYLIAQGPVVLVVVHLVALVVAAAFFSGIIEMIRKTPESQRDALVLAFETWIGLLVSFGLFLVTNNVSAIVFQHSLL